MRALLSSRSGKRRLLSSDLEPGTLARQRTEHRWSQAESVRVKSPVEFEGEGEELRAEIGIRS